MNDLQPLENGIIGSQHAADALAAKKKRAFFLFPTRTAEKLSTLYWNVLGNKLTLSFLPETERAIL